MRGGTKDKTRIRSVVTIVVALTLPLGLAAPSWAYQRPGRTELISRPIADLELPATGECYAPSAGGENQNLLDVTPNGRYVIFASSASNLVPQDRNGACDVFRYDRRKDQISLVSLTSTGTQGTVASTRVPVQAFPNSTDVSVSGNGRYVAFSSIASDLVPGDTNNAWDVFVRDMKLKTTMRVSLSATGEEGKDPASGRYPDSLNASISGNGRYVAFTSSASNLVEDPPIDPNSWPNVFVRDLEERTTLLASLPPKNRPQITTSSMGANSNPSISGNGRYVAFYSRGGNEHIGVHVRDLKKKQTYEVDVVSGEEYRQFGQPFSNAITQGSAARQISTSGRYVVFNSPARHLIPNDRNGLTTDVFVHDLKDGRTERVSVESTGEEREMGGSDSGNWATSGFGPGSSGISPDGRYIIFVSSPDDSSGTEVYLHDRETGALEIVSVNPDRSHAPCNAQESRNSFAGAISLKARYVGFDSTASCLVQDEDLKSLPLPGLMTYLRDRGAEVGVGALNGDNVGAAESPDDRICVEGTCVPPGAAVNSSDETDDLGEVLTEQGANLYGASLAYRPQYDDLFAAIELEHMPQVLSGLSPIVYGLRFKVEGKSYEVRATSLLGGTFGLFDCTGSTVCTKVADLHGGYGTTGMRVVFSLPLDAIGLEEGGKLKDVVASSGLGSYLTGATKLLDRVALK